MFTFPIKGWGFTKSRSPLGHYHSRSSEIYDPVFRMTINSGASKVYSLPLVATGTYNFKVTWGDGTSNTITVWNQAEVSHTYPVINTDYEIEIVGTLYGFNLRYGLAGGNNDKTKEIKSWGTIRLGNQTSNFYHCANITFSAINTLDMTGTTDCSYMFQSSPSITYIPSIGSWDMSNVTTMSYMFAGLFITVDMNPDISLWNTSSCTDMSRMFLYNNTFNRDLNNWDTSNVTDMLSLFDSALSFNGNISSWDTSSVTSMRYMFHATPFNQDISGWNTSSVTTMRDMFRSCTAFNQNIGSWDTSSVINMRDMFLNCASFDQDIGGWDVTALVSAINMFSGVTLSTANYDALLIGWSAQAVQPNVTFHGGSSKYSAGAAAAARAVLTGAPNNWNITDGGVV